jgi:transposase, IS30 family
MVLRRDARVAFWAAVGEGRSVELSSAAAGVSVTTGRNWMREAGGVIPRHLFDRRSGRYLDSVDRSVIMVARRDGKSVRAIATLLGRSPSTVSRELNRNRVGKGTRGGIQRFRPYDARSAQLRAESRAARPQPTKLARDPVLHEYVQTRLDRRWSPEQISNTLRDDFPGEERMRVSHETIYRALFVQARGSLKREVEAKLRTGRTLRKPRKQGDSGGQGKHRIPDMLLISERPAAIEDRAVPGHWEGDLIIGKDSGSQIGTLVERATRFVMLVHLPGSREADVVANALTEVIQTMPAQMAKSLTWDQGIEMARHPDVTIATDIDIYFCDPHSPWQRGSNENTNGLLRQYFPKGTDLSVHSAEHLAFVARELNARPRKTLSWKTPAQAMEQLLLAPQEQDGVATTT